MSVGSASMKKDQTAACVRSLFADLSQRGELLCLSCMTGRLRVPPADRKDPSMKIVVVGGSGLIGSKLVTKLGEHGHEAVSASPSTGVNTSLAKASPRLSSTRRW